MKSSILELERLQEKAISSIGLAPFEIRRCVAVEEKRIAKDHAEIKKENAEGFNIEALQMALPEKLYGDPDELIAKYTKPNKTKYDRISFLERFYNIENLCHEYFTQTTEVDHIPIHIASLPFSQVNGVAYYDTNKNPIVLLNDGLLIWAPHLLSLTVPLTDLKSSFKNLECGQQVDEALKAVNQYHGKYFSEFTLIFIEILQGRLHSTDIDNPNTPPRLMTQESWGIKEELMRNIRESFALNRNEGEIENTVSKEKAQFLRTRGFFTLLVGHEFSHFYRNHHQIREMKTPIRSEAYRNNLAGRISEYFNHTNISGINVHDHHFVTSQPLETQADHDALQCVIKYCVENELNTLESEQVILGALNVFLFMEFTDRFNQLSNLGLDGLRRYNQIPSEFKNVIHPTEHPHPFSRVPIALEEHLWKEHSETVSRKMILRLWEDIEYSFDWLWKGLEGSLDKHIKTEGYNPICQVNRANLMSDFHTLGCYENFLHGFQRKKSTLYTQKISSYLRGLIKT